MITFNDILGQESAVEAISRAYRLDRLPHGLIFAGPVGVGKATTALALGGLFLCEKPKGISPCGKCASCRTMAAGNHPDYHVIYRQLARLDRDVKAKELAADVVRHFLIDKANNKSVVGIGKVFVIEEADLMTMTAQNALLKTLEEPAGRSLIILLTDQPDGLLATIRSRSQLVRFAPLDEKIVSEQLQSKHGIRREVAASAGKLSQGSLGLALRWIEDEVIDRAAELHKMLERLADGQPAPGLQEWFKSAADSYAEKQLKRDEKASKDQMTREGLVLYLKLAAQYFQGQLAGFAGDPPLLERTAAAVDTIVRAEGYLESNVNIPLVLQQLAGALARGFRPSEAAPA